VFLDSLEAHVPTTLTLQMIHNSSKSCKLTAITTVWAVVELLLVNRGVKVLVQGCKFTKEAMAEVALIGFDSVVPCPLGGLVADSARLGK